MSDPFFTVAVPSKNRPSEVDRTLRSVLEQTFENIEVVVCDNSDTAAAAQTRAVVERFDDARVRYIRASGRLSMPDNWDHAVAAAKGEYVGILTDRSVLRRDALEVVHREIAATDAKLVNWFNDLYARDPAGTAFKRRQSTFKRHRFTADEVLDYFVHGHPKFSPKIVPKLMTSVCHRSILDAIRSSPVGRCCPPVSPDFTSGFLMLAHCEWFLTLDESLYVSCGVGNGSAFRRRGELAERFRQDLGMEWVEMVDRMPSAACFSHAAVLNDLTRIRDMIPDRLPGIEIDRTQYYLGCMYDYVKTSKHGVRRDEDLSLLLDALDREPAEIRDRVKATTIFTDASTPTAAKQVKEKAKARVRATIGPTAQPAFDTVFEAMAWDAANPRTPADSSFLDVKPGIDQLRTPTRPKRVKRRTARVWTRLAGARARH